jgi:hypothetical protein
LGLGLSAIVDFRIEHSAIVDFRIGLSAIVDFRIELAAIVDFRIELSAIVDFRIEHSAIVDLFPVCVLKNCVRLCLSVHVNNRLCLSEVFFYMRAFVFVCACEESFYCWRLDMAIQCGAHGHSSHTKHQHTWRDMLGS